MTVFAKNTTYGLETRVKELQEHLDSNLPNFWSGELEIYGILFPKIKQSNGADIVVPEAYIGTGINKGEYSEVLINDNVAASIGFIVQERTTTPYRAANIDVVFTIQIPNIYPNDTERHQEKAMLEAEKIIESWGGVAEVQDLKEGVEEVFSGFDTQRIKHRDMHPWHVFALNIDVQYTDDSCQ
jgi:hypothetical protein